MADGVWLELTRRQSENPVRTYHRAGGRRDLTACNKDTKGMQSLAVAWSSLAAGEQCADCGT